MSKVGSESKQTVSGFSSVALSTLASRDLALANATHTMVAGGTLVSLTAAVVILNPDQFDGPFLWGVSTGALSAAEIEAAIENTGPSGPAHSAQTELGSRFRHIRVLGLINPDPLSTSNPSAATAFIRNMRIKLGWAEQDGGWRYWVYNLGSDLVTGSTLEITDIAFVIFDRD